MLQGQDRINLFYNPTTGMLGNDVIQLMDGIDYGGVEVKSFHLVQVLVGQVNHTTQQVMTHMIIRMKMKFSHLTEVLICLHWLNLKMVLCTTCTKMVLE